MDFLGRVPVLALVGAADRHPDLAVLAFDLARSLDDLEVGDVAEQDRPAARVGDRDLAQVLEARPVLHAQGEPGDDLAVAGVEAVEADAAEGEAEDLGDVGGGAPEFGDAIAVEADLDLAAAGGTRSRHVFDAVHGVEPARRLVGEPVQGRGVGSEEFDREVGGRTALVGVLLEDDADARGRGQAVADRGAELLHLVVAEVLAGQADGGAGLVLGVVGVDGVDHELLGVGLEIGLDLFDHLLRLALVVEIVELVVEIEPRVEGAREDRRVDPADEEGQEADDQTDHQQTEGLDPVLEGPAEDPDIAFLEPLDDAGCGRFS